MNSNWEGVSTFSYFKETVSRKLRHRLLYIIFESSPFKLWTHAIKSNFYWSSFTQFTFLKINGTLSTIPLKFSVKSEKKYSFCVAHFLWQFFVCFCAKHHFLSFHNYFKVYVWPIFLFFCLQTFLWSDNIRWLAPFLSLYTWGPEDF